MRESRPPRKKKSKRLFHTAERFPERAKRTWEGPLVDYKEIELLRKFLTTSFKQMSRKRAGTTPASSELCNWQSSGLGSWP